MLKNTNCHRLLSTPATLQPLLSDLLSELKSADDAYELAIEELLPLLVAYPRLGAETEEDYFQACTKLLPTMKPEDVVLYLQ